MQKTNLRPLTSIRQQSEHARIQCAGLAECATLKCVRVRVQVLATAALWEVLSNAEVVAFVGTYCAAGHAELSAADALSWEAQQRLKARDAQVRSPPLAARPRRPLEALHPQQDCSQSRALLRPRNAAVESRPLAQ